MKNENKIKLSGISILLCIVIAIIAIVLIFEKTNTNNKESSIEFFSLKTHAGFNESFMNSKFKITSKQEFDTFQSLYGGFELSNQYDLSRNTIFIQTESCGSGSINIKFKKVKITKDDVEFIYSSNNPQTGTMDMAYWYFVAIIPNTKLEGINIENWKSPIDIYNNLK